MAIIFRTDGTTTHAEPKNGTDFKLEELKSIVEGYIEIVNLPHGLIMVVNEEGAINGMPLNDLASIAFARTIYGNILVCDANQIK